MGKKRVVWAVFTLSPINPKPHMAVRAKGVWGKKGAFRVVVKDKGYRSETLKPKCLTKSHGLGLRV